MCACVFTATDMFTYFFCIGSPLLLKCQKMPSPVKRSSTYGMPKCLIKHWYRFTYSLGKHPVLCPVHWWLKDKGAGSEVLQLCSYSIFRLICAWYEHFLKVKEGQFVFLVFNTGERVDLKMSNCYHYLSNGLLNSTHLLDSDQNIITDVMQHVCTS